MWTRLSGFALAPLALLGGCALQPSYHRPVLNIPGSWSNAPDGSSPSAPVDRQAWWTLLGDPFVDQLVMAGLRDNPTLAEAAARVDQARAVLGVQDARKIPTVGAEANVTRSRDRDDPSSGTIGETSAAITARLSWELDLWGRVRESSIAAQNRLTARTADAEGARLSIIGEIADTALALRACNLTLEIRDGDITSRKTELKISRARLVFGNIAPVAVAEADSNLASARTDRVSQEETCRRLVNALVALSGLDVGAIRDLLLMAPRKSAAGQDDRSVVAPRLPEPPPFVPALPATVLLGNPGVAAAEREAAARWSEIAVARAERLPRVDLVAVLTGQWIRALGSSSSYVSGSAGASLTAPLIDGGAGAANVRGAEAAYREAAAQLVYTVRAAIRDIEDGLAAQQSAVLRIETTQEALEAARFTLSANEARWRAGAIAQFELEESRRQFNQAQQSAIAALADRARAWVALVRRTGLVAGIPAAEPSAAANKIDVLDLASGDKPG